MYLRSIPPCAGGAYQQNVQDLKGPTVKRVEIFNLGKDNQADHPGAWQQAEAEGRTERAKGKAPRDRVSVCFFWGGGRGRVGRRRERRGESPRSGKRGEPSIYRMKGRKACVFLYDSVFRGRRGGSVNLIRLLRYFLPTKISLWSSL
jgi:hypothetical protein